MTARELIARLTDARPAGPRRWMARCPAHDDRNRSLSVAAGDDRILLHCFAGCGVEEIVAAAGLAIGDLFAERRTRRAAAATITVEDLARDKALPVELLRAAGLFDLPDGGGVGIPYRAADGRTIVKRRTALVARQGSFWPKGQRLLAYGIWRLPEARAARQLVLVEGESDCWTLWHHGIPALGVPGAANARTLAREHLAEVDRVYVVREPDRGGETFVAGVAAQLAHLGWRGAAFEVRLPDAKDPNDLHRRDPAAFREAFQRAIDEASALAPPGATPPITGGEPRDGPPTPGTPLTDLGNAERFAGRNGASVRYLPQRGRWLVWDGRRWALDERGAVQQLAAETVRAIYREAADAPKPLRAAIARHAVDSEASARISAMLRLAQFQPGLPVLSDELDQDPYALNVANGTLDLRTGTLRPHRREDLHTRLAPVVFDPSASCARWQAFLDRILDRNAELGTFLQRAVGYSLTGDVSEHVLLICWGNGANGKSTLLETVQTLLGDYAKTAEASTFLEKKTDSVRNDLAMLHGARFVSAIETEDGRRLAESFVKQVTGGDTITARFLYGEHFSFRPAFKVWLASNHKPVVRGTDEGIWRRLRLIPFTVTIPEDDRDKHFREKLCEELPGILNWALAGCLAWQREGLARARAIQEATAAYRDKMDPLSVFFEERCVLAPTVAITTRALYGAYVTWCQETEERPLSSRAFGRCLAGRGLSPLRLGHGRERGWQGITLASLAQSDAQAATSTGSVEPERATRSTDQSLFDLDDDEYWKW
jgi:putative DNA primase/helicase